MPTHQEDLAFIPTIKYIIIQQVQRNPHSHIILCYDFNGDILLMARSHDSIFTPPQSLAYQWQQLMDTLQLHYITNIQSKVDITIPTLVFFMVSI
jgi:hypothetical protein